MRSKLNLPVLKHLMAQTSAEEYFPVLGEALIDTLKDTWGEALTPEVEFALAMMYGLI